VLLRIVALQLVGKPLNKAWSRDSVKGLYLREIRKAKNMGDARRTKELTAYAIGGTGGGPGLDPLQQMPADDIEPPRVDPRLLTCREPILDHLSPVVVPAGSCFSSSQDHGGVYSRVAPPPARGLRPRSTVTSGAYEAQLAATAAISAEVPEQFVVELDDVNMEWAQEILNNSNSRELSMESSLSPSPVR